MLGQTRYMTETPNVRPTRNLIVVGVDDSEGSADALRWAVSEAKLRGAKVRAVFAWGYPVYTGLEGAAFYLDPAERLLYLRRGPGVGLDAKRL